MGVRTFSRAAWQEAQAAWDAGEFSDEWPPFRELAARHGMLYPPAGTRWDSWEDDQPSQRAILVRAIRDTPTVLRACIERSSSWSQVIEMLIAAIGDERQRATTRDDEIAARRRERPGRIAAMESYAEIARRMACLDEEREQERLEKIAANQAAER